MSDTETKIIAIIDKIRPYIQTHGGDVRLIGIEDSVATFHIDGACTHCPLAELTYNKIIRTLILEDVPEIQTVVFNGSLLSNE